MSSEEGDKWEAFAHGREWLRGEKPDDPEAFEHAGLVGDDSTRRLLSVARALYDPSMTDEPMPPRFEDTELYRHLVGVESTETLTRAVHEGRAPTLSYAVGDPAAKSDISGLSAAYELEELMAGRAPVLYIFGPMGAGKTSKACLAAQLYARAEGGDPFTLDGVEVASNLRTLEQADAHIDTFTEVKRWFEQNVTTDENGAEVRVEGSTPKLYIHDEASSSISGRGAQGAEVGEKYAPLVYAIRKANGALVVIGHDGRDVHPVFRALGIVVEAYRDEQKRMTVWEDVKDRSGVGQIMELRGVPDTDLDYNDGEQPTFSWGSEPETDAWEPAEVEALASDVEEAERRRLMHSLEEARQAGALGADVSQADLGHALGVSGSTVSKWYRRIERGEYEPGEVAPFAGAL